MTDDRHDLRCFCRRHPLLAVWGIDPKTRKAYVHLKVYRGQRIQAEMVAIEGSVRLRCRECLRWHTIHIRRAEVDFAPSTVEESSKIPPEMIADR